MPPLEASFDTSPRVDTQDERESEETFRERLAYVGLRLDGESMKKVLLLVMLCCVSRLFSAEPVAPAPEIPSREDLWAAMCKINPENHRWDYSDLFRIMRRIPHAERGCFLLDSLLCENPDARKALRARGGILFKRALLGFVSPLLYEGLFAAYREQIIAEIKRLLLFGDSSNIEALLRLVPEEERTHIFTYEDCLRVICSKSVKAGEDYVTSRASVLRLIFACIPEEIRVEWVEGVCRDVDFALDHDTQLVLAKARERKPFSLKSD